MDGSIFHLPSFALVSSYLEIDAHWQVNLDKVTQESGQAGEETHEHTVGVRPKELEGSGNTVF